MDKPRRKPGLGVSKNGKNCIDGKEESYERNPGGVPFVFNPKFSERFNVLKTCSGWRKHIFDSLSPGGSRGLTKRAEGPIISIEGRCGGQLSADPLWFRETQIEKPSPARVAVSAFYDDRDRKGSDM